MRWIMRLFAGIGLLVVLLIGGALFAVSRLHISGRAPTAIAEASLSSDGVIELVVSRAREITGARWSGPRLVSEPPAGQGTLMLGQPKTICTEPAPSAWIIEHQSPAISMALSELSTYAHPSALAAS